MKRMLRLAYLSDVGEVGAAQTAAAALVESWNVDGILLAGDNAGYDAHTAAEALAVWQPWIDAGKVWPVYGERDIATLAAQQSIFNYLPQTWGGRYYALELGGGLLHLGAWRSGFNSANALVEPDGNTAGSVQGSRLYTAAEDSTAWWKVSLCHHPGLTQVNPATLVPTMAHLPQSGAYDLCLFGHTLGVEHWLNNLNMPTPWLNASGCVRPQAGYGAEVGSNVADFFLFSGTSDEQVVTLLTITPEAIVWEFYDVREGSRFYLGGTCSHRALATPGLRPPALGDGSVPERDVNFRRILHAVSHALGDVPEEDGLSVGTAAQIANAASRAAKFAWEFHDWPDAMVETVREVETAADGTPFIPARRDGHVIEHLLDVWTRNPALGNCPQSVMYVRARDGYHLPGYTGETVWTRHRPPAPRFSAMAYRADTIYRPGESCYLEATGHSYQLLSAEPVTGVPPSDTTVWAVTTLPACLVEPVIAGATALMQAADGATATAAVLNEAMVNLLDHELVIIQNQEQKDGVYAAPWRSAC